MTESSEEYQDNFILFMVLCIVAGLIYVAYEKGYVVFGYPTLFDNNEEDDLEQSSITPIPEPGIGPIPAPRPAPIQAPRPAPVSVPGIGPIPAPRFAPVPAPVSVPGIGPIPAPRFAPVPAPVSVPGIGPIPAPRPAPVPAPRPAPVPAPRPAPIFSPPPILTLYPNMALTSNNSNGFVVSASSALSTSNQAWNVFDTIPNTSWTSNTNYNSNGTYPYPYVYTSRVSNSYGTFNYEGEWIQIRLPKRVRPVSVTLRSGSGNTPRSIAIVAGNDGSNWVQLLASAQINWSTNETKIFAVNTSVQYNFYRVIISQLNGSSLSGSKRSVVISEMRVSSYD